MEAGADYEICHPLKQIIKKLMKYRQDEVKHSKNKKSKCIRQMKKDIWLTNKEIIYLMKMEIKSNSVKNSLSSWLMIDHIINFRAENIQKLLYK